MERRRLGRSPVEVTTLSFGGAAIGGLFAPVSDADATAAVHRARERGIGYFDTAPHYGAGRSERRLGAALTGAPAGADRSGESAGASQTGASAGAVVAGGYVLSTKVGRLLVPLGPGEPPEPEGFADPPPYRRVWDWSADGIRRSLEESLKRLGADRVDVVYLHDPDEHEEEVYATAYPALAALRDEGVIGAIGAGMNQTPMLTRFVERLDLDVVLCAGRYTLLDRSAEEDLFPACARRGTSVVAGGVYNSGLLAGGTTYDYAPASPELRERVARLERVCAGHGVPLRAAALRFPLRHPAVASVLVGCRNAAEVDDNCDLFELDIPEALWEAL
ncbi:aldo/keto reductase [Actinoallomurus rhizosphaericola]|uniref:aldo/keto reductase n=1 Tax=Actinoallomurus rhizosphaericola TaxID=2952536 RepID=UPI002093A0CE|nr:aldo/keto reductase [Actinoallomurus rhizosphaericola]MCO5997753.1 aldo/keto reductase [Actinoallomurus rhizosphaericola]